MNNNSYEQSYWSLNSYSFNTFAYFDKAFTEEEVNNIRELEKEINFVDAKLGIEQLYDASFRKTKICFLKSNDINFNWIFRKCVDLISLANSNFFKFDINTIELLQYGLYEEDSFFAPHIDLTDEGQSLGMRKLSFSVQLSDTFEYEGGDLNLLCASGKTYYTADRRKGSMIFFPSFVGHEVTPITKGIRRSLVGWVLGPNFK